MSKEENKKISSVGESGSAVRQRIFSAEEINESNLRVALMGEVNDLQDKHEGLDMSV